MVPTSDCNLSSKVFNIPAALGYTEALDEPLAYKLHHREESASHPTLPFSGERQVLQVGIDSHVKRIKCLRCVSKTENRQRKRD